MKYELPNIFLHFLNWDTQEIFGLVDNDLQAFSNIQLSLNASILLSKEYCILPLGFYFESENTKKVILDNLEYIREGLLVFAMREYEIQEYIEKKQGQLKNFMSDANYYRFFESENKELLNIKFATIPRKTKIGEYCLLRWRHNLEIFIEDLSGDIAEIYDVDKKTIGKDTIEIAKAILGKSCEIEEGNAFIWRLMKEEFRKLTYRDSRLEHQMRMYFEKNYYKAYLDEYQASILYDIFPLENGKDFFLKKEYISASNFRWFYEFLCSLELGTILRYNASQISRIKRLPEFVQLVQIYLDICNSDSFEHSSYSIKTEFARMYSSNYKNLKELESTIKDRINKFDSSKSSHFNEKKENQSLSHAETPSILITNSEVMLSGGEMKVDKRKAEQMNITEGNSYTNEQDGIFIAAKDSVILSQPDDKALINALEELLQTADSSNKADIQEAISAAKQSDESRFKQAMRKVASFASSFATKAGASLLVEYLKQNGML